MPSRRDRLIKTAATLEMAGAAAQMRLVVLAREERRLIQRRDDLINALNEPGPCQGLFVAAMTRRLSSFEVELQAIVEATKTEASNARRAEVRSRAASQLVDRLTRDLRDSLERKTLEEISAPRTFVRFPQGPRR